MKYFFILILSTCLFQSSAKDSAPVNPFGDTLFTINAKVGSFTPKERASAIKQRIIGIAKEVNDFSNDSIMIQLSEWGWNIIYEDKIIMVVMDADTIGTNNNVKELATHHADTIKQSINTYRQKTEFKNILLKLGFAMAAIIIFLIIILLINKLYKWVLRKLTDWKDTKIKSIKLNNYEFMNTDRLIWLFSFVANIVRIVFIIIAIYILLPVLFSIFPATKKWAELIFEYTLTPLRHVLHSIINYIPNVFSILIIYGFTFYIVKGFKFLSVEIAKGSLKMNGFYPDWAKPTFNIVRFLLYAFMLIVIFPYLPGSNSPAFRGVSVFLGVLISFGSSTAIANAVAGLVITFMRPFKVGDRVKIGDVSGDIIEKSTLVTRIRTIKNEEITVPNATILSVYSVNYSNQAMNKGLILHTSITIGYDAPWRKVHELLLKAASKTELIEKKPTPFVFQVALNDFYVEYQINAYTHHARGMAAIYSELHQHIQDCFNEAGVEIMSPHYGSLRNGNTTTIPEKYRPSDYKADVFEVNNKG
jgi:small-conductance mechanosensitive channel